MFRALFRIFRALAAWLTGRRGAARQAWHVNPAVIGATFDSIIDEKRQRIQQSKDTMAALIAHDERKSADLKRQTEEVARLEGLRDGAAAMAKRVVERHAGDVAAVRRDPDYIRCQAAFADFSSTLAEKRARGAELEADIHSLETLIGGYKRQLESLLGELEQVQREKQETVADVITARQEREVADMIAGIHRDRTSQQLQDLRDLRFQAQATARVSRDLAVGDAQRSEEEFRVYAARSAADPEFDALIGLTKQAQPAGEPAPAKTPLPEK